MKKILLLAFTILLTGCSLGQPTKESETEKLENYLEEISWVREAEYSKNFINEIAGNYEDYPSFDKNYQFEKINTNDLTYTETYSSVNQETNFANLYNFTYDYKQDIAKGTYVQTFLYNGIEKNITSIYMYDYKNGIKECTKKEEFGTGVSECNISGEIMGSLFLETKQNFLDILENSGVDNEILLQ